MDYLGSNRGQGRRLLVLGTTSQRSVMVQLDMKQTFNRELAVPNINTHEELRTALIEFGAFENESDLNQSLTELRDITGTEKVGLGIKNILTTVGQAKRDKNNFPGTFADMMAQQMADNMV